MTLMKAIAQCTGRTINQIKVDAKETGDLGIVAENSRSNQRTMFRPAPLTVSLVYNRLKEIAMMTGQAVNHLCIYNNTNLFSMFHLLNEIFLNETGNGKEGGQNTKYLCGLPRL